MRTRGQAAGSNARAILKRAEIMGRWPALRAAYAGAEGDLLDVIHEDLGDLRSKRRATDQIARRMAEEAGVPLAETRQYAEDLLTEVTS
jgi:hypothetical protein